ncbi:MAG: hypothetical protein AB9891_16735 [Anaerolineaceae bacterium]
MPGDVSATGYRLYVIAPEAPGSELLATFGPLSSIDKRHAFTHKALYGTYTYYSEAFNAKGTVQSQPISLDIKDAECSANAKKAANVKLITGYGLDDAYCYVTNIGSNIHIRMPLVDGTFIHPMDAAELQTWGAEWLPGVQITARTGYDLGPYLPALSLNSPSGATLKFECLGWGGGNLQNLGFAQKTFTANDLHKVVVIDSPKYQVVGVFGDTTLDTGKQTIVLPQPINLKSTGNPEECAAHDPSSYNLAACQQNIKSGMAAFTWDIKEASCPPGSGGTCTPANDIDGFRIYRQTLPNPQDVYGVQGGTKVTGGFAPWPPDWECANMEPQAKKLCRLENPPCYTVRAYKGSLQSADSNVACIGEQDEATGAKTITLDPSAMGVTLVDSSTKGGTPEAYGPLYVDFGLKTNGEIYAGYEDLDRSSWDLYRDYWGLFMFNLDEVLGKPILSARLTFTKFGSFHAYAEKPVLGFNCVRSLGISKAEGFHPTVKYSGTIPQTILYKPLPEIESGNLEYDVTDAVKAWSQGKVNTGFVLDGRDPYWPAPYHRNQCINYFNNFKLEITYFPNP